MITRVTERNTKAQILSAFEALFESHQKLEKRAQSAERRLTTLSPGAGVDDDEVVNIATILGQLDGLRPRFRDAAASISGDLIVEATALHALRADIDAQLTQLKSLHGIEVNDEPLDVISALLDRYDAQSQSFTTAHDARVTAFTEQMQARKTDWERERLAHTQQVSDRDRARKTAVKRDNAQYEYDLRRSRQLEQEGEEAEKRSREKALDAEIHQTERAWEATEQEIAAQEAAFAEARQQAEDLDVRLGKARKQATEEGVAIARRQARVRAERLEKQVDGERRVYELQIAGLEERITEQQSRIKALNTQLAATLGQAQALAVKAIEGAELNASFETLKRIALEQARTNAKSK
ncbi:MAG: hypothetical protein AAFV53_23320 [Myxococcota bacterium]